MTLLKCDFVLYGVRDDKVAMKTKKKRMKKEIEKRNLTRSESFRII